MNVDRNLNKALYRQIYEIIKKDILGGKYAGGNLLPSERDLCTQFDVDRITVRKSLGLLVEEGLIEKKPGLGTLIKEFPINKVWPSGSKNLVFALPKGMSTVDRITETFNSALFYRIERECASKGYNLIYTTAAAPEDISRLLDSQNIAGFFFVSRVEDKMVHEAVKKCIPIVLINHYIRDMVSVVTDNENGAYEAVRHLIHLGHKRIGAILGTKGYLTTDERFAGYKKALIAFNLEPEQKILQGDWSFDGGYTAMKEVLSDKSCLPSAFFALNDAMAFGAMEAIKEAGLSIPGDISMIGFDDVEQCTYVRPRLTSVSANADMLAKAACQQLLGTIEGGIQLNAKIVVSTKLALRESTAPMVPR